MITSSTSTMSTIGVTLMPTIPARPRLACCTDAMLASLPARVGLGPARAAEIDRRLGILGPSAFAGARRRALPARTDEGRVFLRLHERGHQLDQRLRVVLDFADAL